MKKSENLNKKPHKTQKSDNLNKISKKIHKIHIPTGQLHHFMPIFASFPLVSPFSMNFIVNMVHFAHTYSILRPFSHFPNPFLKSAHYVNIIRPLTAQHTLMIPLSLAIFISLKSHVKRPVAPNNLIIMSILPRIPLRYAYHRPFFTARNLV